MNIESEIAAFRQQLQALADPHRAEGEKAYLKSPLDFYGLTVPALDRIASQWSKEHRQTGITDVVALAGRLWDSTYHEEKSLAIMLLQHRRKELTLEHIPLVEKMIGEATTWAHLDEIAVHLVGSLIDNDPRTLACLPVWAQSDNFWVRRAAILAQLPQFRRGQGDFDLFARLAVPMFREGEQWSKEERFFIRKAIGWVLRELSKANPELVYEFVRQHRHEMPGLTFREATRRLPAEYADRFTG